MSPEKETPQLPQAACSSVSQPPLGVLLKQGVSALVSLSAEQGWRCATATVPILKSSWGMPLAGVDSAGRQANSCGPVTVGPQQSRTGAWALMNGVQVPPELAPTRDPCMVETAGWVTRSLLPRVLEC